MAPTKAVSSAPYPDDTSLIRLSQLNIDDAIRLSTEAGWNQTTNDWMLFLRHGTVFGIIENGTLSASAAIIPYGPEIAWISMVLTRECRRGNGLGTRLLTHCLSVIEGEKRTALLDATPAGEIVYRKLGFEGLDLFTRWVGTGGGKPRNDAPPPDITSAIMMANRAFGADRTDLLANFANGQPNLCRYEPNMGLCAFGRDGRIATQIGPVVSNSMNPDSLEIVALIASLTDAITGPVFMDVADHCAQLGTRLEMLGFEKQRPFLRMKRGPWLPPKNGPVIAVIAGPEFG